MSDKPLTPEEVQAAADRFFPLFNIVQSNMPAESSTEDSLKVMETVCKLAHKLRSQKTLESFGFLSKDEEWEPEV